MNLASIIEAHDPQSVALISRGRTTTYGELNQQVAGLRGGLAGLGIEAGDRVAILCANNWYFRPESWSESWPRSGCGPSWSARRVGPPSIR